LTFYTAYLLVAAPCGLNMAAEQIGVYLREPAEMKVVVERSNLKGFARYE